MRVALCYDLLRFSPCSGDLCEAKICWTFQSYLLSTLPFLLPPPSTNTNTNTNNKNKNKKTPTPLSLRHCHSKALDLSPPHYAGRERDMGFSQNLRYKKTKEQSSPLLLYPPTPTNCWGMGWARVGFFYAHVLFSGSFEMETETMHIIISFYHSVFSFQIETIIIS